MAFPCKKHAQSDQFLLMTYTLDQGVEVTAEMTHFHLARQLHLCKVCAVQFPKQQSSCHVVLVGSIVMM